ncbi:MAG: MBL fold metallo-hydrolase [Mycolicibacterium sp.]|uniref:MBL fold metallo-hydrolase n=1 Tax=Mycolicibacterium sp. TaxID=2320850 RepID=UPI003D0CAE6F
MVGVTFQINHINCASMAPRVPGGLAPERMVAHCLLVERDTGLVLVDTGFGTVDIAERRMGRAFIAFLGAALDPAETALAQVRAAGYEASDVTDIVVTHLDLDHAGGLGDFPQARVHVFGEELAAARARKSYKERNRYVAAQWSHHPNWVEHEVVGESWLGFGSVRVLGNDLLLVPLQGHSRGHCGVAVRRPSGGWFLHAGDSYFSYAEKETPPTCPSGLALFQSIVQMDKSARLANQDRLRHLHAEHGPGSGSPEEVTVFSAHDAREFAALAGVVD